MDRRFALPCALVALVLYVPGVTLPAVEVEKLGRVRVSSVLDGCRQLARDGELFLAAVVGITALIVPPLKMMALVWVASAPPGGPASPRLSRAAEVVGRFGLLDVFLVAILVALLRLGPIVRFSPLIGLQLFAASAVLALVSSALLAKEPEHVRA